MQTLNVLIVEDMPEYREAYKHSLANHLGQFVRLNFPHEVTNIRGCKDLLRKMDYEIPPWLANGCLCVIDANLHPRSEETDSLPLTVQLNSLQVYQRLPISLWGVSRDENQEFWSGYTGWIFRQYPNFYTGKDLDHPQLGPSLLKALQYIIQGGSK